MTGVRLVVFDVDDTLYLERDYVRSGFAAVSRWAASELGIADFFQQAWRRFESGARGTIFNDVLTSAGISADAVGTMVQIYRTHQPEIALLDDARRTLTALHRIVPLAAVTDGPVASQTAKITALGLDSWLDPIMCTEALGAEFRKPASLAFEHLEAKTGLRGKTCLYVADNPLKDFAGPKNLGWQTVRVRRPQGLHHAQPSGADVDREVADLAGLAELVGDA